MNTKSTTNLIVVLCIVGIGVLLNVLSLNHFVRLDLTAEGIFTLSEASVKTMQDLEDPITVTAYFSEDLPTQFEPVKRYVKDTLEEYRASSKGMLSFEFIDPRGEETEEDKELKKDTQTDIFGRRVREQTSVEAEMAGLGIQPVEMRVIEADNATTKRGYMGMVIRYQDSHETIPVIQDVGSLEYDLTTMIRRLARTRVPVLGVTQGKGEPTLDEDLARLKPLLEQNYEIKALDLSAADDPTTLLDNQIDALLVLGNKEAYGPAQQKAIDQWLMTGKAGAFLVNLMDVDLKTFQPAGVTHGWDTLLATYGIEIGDKLVADVECASLSIQERRGRMIVNQPVKYPFIPQLKLLEGDSPISKGLQDVPMPFVAPLFLKSDIPNVAVTSLAKSTDQSWLEEAEPTKISPRRDWATEQVQVSGPYDLLATAEGTFPSAYADTAAFKTSQAPSRVFVAGTAGIARDEFLSPTTATLLLNIVDWMLLDPGLLEMRSRGMSEAPIDPELSDSTRAAVKNGLVASGPIMLGLYGFLRRRVRNRRRKALMSTPA